MRIKMFLIAIISFSTIFIYCNQDDGRSSKKQIFSKSKTKCVEPQNPYNDESGHGAGFNWAAENGGECEGNSESFNEGCQEYYRQLNEYNDCIKNNQ
jgi:hypothetical protein